MAQFLNAGSMVGSQSLAYLSRIPSGLDTLVQPENSGSYMDMPAVHGEPGRLVGWYPWLTKSVTGKLGCKRPGLCGRKVNISKVIDSFLHI